LAERELLHQVLIRAPIQRVWDELTKLSGRQRAMMDLVLDSTLEVGAPLYYRTSDGKRVFVVGRVLEVEAPHRLRHTQRVTTRDDPFTIVTWELAETADGTAVTLRHTGWPEGTRKLEQVDRTWAGILPQLKHVLEHGDVSIGKKLEYLFYGLFMWALPARTKTENVPAPD
jgi:uncharacterized protein YndB with AHSA1/START domain